MAIRLKGLRGSALILAAAIATANVALAEKEKDVKRGHHVDALIRDSLPLLEDERLHARIEEVGTKVVAASGNPQSHQFQFRIVNESDPNAFAMPAGYVYITTGLLKDLESEDELAAVLAHEIAHVNKRHTMKLGMGPKARTFWTIALSFGGQFTGEYLGEVVGKAVASKTLDSLLAEQTAALVSNVTFLATSRLGESTLKRIYRGYDDKHEFEADELAIQYSRRARYDPLAMAQVMDRMLLQSEVDPSDLIIARLHCSRETLTKRKAGLQRLLKKSADSPDRRR